MKLSVDDLHQYFLIEHRCPLKVQLLPENAPWPTLSQLQSRMPPAFRIAAQVNELDQASLRPLRHLSDHAAELVEFLNLQNQKINLMLSYILATQQDDDSQQFQTHAYGGGGVVFDYPQPLDTGQLLEVRLFLNEIACAVFCYAAVVDCQVQGDNWRLSAAFACIRDEDREAIVRASLHEQTRQLRQLAQKRQQSS